MNTAHQTTAVQAVSRGGSLMPSPQEWAILKEQATFYVRSGLLPASVNTPEKAITIAMKGRELGIPPLQAFAHINVISGKPAISSELMLALIYKNCAGAIVNFLRTDNQACEIEARRPGGNPTKFKFSIEDAQQAQVLGKDGWKKYPAAMLRARCISAMARATFPDAINGCSYTPEELGAEVDEDGAIIAEPVVVPKAEDAALPPVHSLDNTKPTPVMHEAASSAEGHGSFIPTFGKFKDKPLSSVKVDDLEGYLRWLKDGLKKSPQTKPQPNVKAFIDAAEAYLAARDEIKF